MVPGPSEPATKRLRSGVEKPSATSRAMRALARAISWAALGDVVLAERHAEGAEGVGLDHVGADLEVGGVQGGDHVGAGDAQDVGAALDGLAAVVVEVEVLGLQPGAGGAVVHDDAFGYEVQE